MPADDVDKFLSEEKAFEDRRQQLVDELMKQKAAAMKEFDEKLARLGYHGDGAGKPRRDHHKKGAPRAVDKTKA
jgi:hypothetical protein